MAPRPFSQEDSQLITELHSLHKKSPKLVKAAEYATPALPDLTVESWKMNEFKYYEVPSPFPTLARGLFSMKEPKDESRYLIVARGYDKFFNIGEVPWTTVRVILYFIDSNLIIIWPVVIPGGPYQATLYPDAQVEWMYHIHRGSIAD